MLVAVVVAGLLGAIPSPVEVAQGQEGVRTLIADSKHLYWLTDDGSGNGALLRVAHGGEEVSRLAEKLAMADAVTVDATGVVVSVGAKVMRLDGGGPLVELADSSFPESGGTVFKHPVGIASDGTTVFWTTGDLLVSVARRGGERKVMKTGLEGATDVVVDGQSLYLLSSGRPFAKAPSGTLIRVDKASGKSVVLAKGLSVPAHLRMSGDHLFWTEDNRRLLRLPKRGGTPPAQLTQGDSVQDFAVAAGAVYWLSGQGAGAVLRVALDGSGEVTVAEKLDSPMTIAAGAGNLFWGGGASTRVMRLQELTLEQVAAAPKPPAPTRGGIERKGSEKIVTNETFGFRLRVPAEWELSLQYQDDPDGTVNADGSVTYSGGLSTTAPGRWNAVSVNAPAPVGIHRMTVFAHPKPGLELAGARELIEKRARAFHAQIGAARELKLKDGTPALLVGYSLGTMEIRTLLVVKGGVRYELALVGGMDGKPITEAPLVDLAERFTAFAPREP